MRFEKQVRIRSKLWWAQVAVLRREGGGASRSYMASYMKTIFRFLTLQCFKSVKLLLKELLLTSWENSERNAFLTVAPRDVLRYLQIVFVGSRLKRARFWWFSCCMIQSNWKGRHVRDRRRRQCFSTGRCCSKKIFEQSQWKRIVYH